MIIVEVTEADIAKAINQRPRAKRDEALVYYIDRQCPVAFAFQRATGNDNAVWGYTTGQVGDSVYRVVGEHYKRAVEDIVKAFDLRIYKNIKPIAFRVEVD